MIQRHYWKVVYDVGGILHSCIANNTDYDVIYKLNEWVYPPAKLSHSKLMLFNTYENANNFCNTLGKPMSYRKSTGIFTIYKALAKKPADHSGEHVLCPFIDDNHHNVIRDYWNVYWGLGGICSTSHMGYTYRCPTGTIFADSVKLLEETTGSNIDA